VNVFGRACLLVSTVVLVVLLGGCGSSTPSTSSAPPPGPLAASETSNGTTMTLAVGQKLIVTLHSTYWQFGSPSNVAIVTPQGQAVAAVCSAPPPYPGSGCGTVTQGYHGVRAGTAVLNASRNSCGEALACRPDQSSWQLTVLVR
jgi:hypothetical protein